MTGMTIITRWRRREKEYVSWFASAFQWRSQDITDARAHHGRTTFVRNSARSAEALGDLGHSLLENVRNFITSHVGSEAIS